MRIVAILGLLVLLVLAWTQWPSTPEQGPAVPSAASAADPAVERTPASGEVADAADAAKGLDATATRTEAPSAPTVPPGPEAVLRGRCVDAQGLPIAGVEARLTGWVASSERLDAWSKDHDQPKQVQVETASDTDGVFEIRFWPPPPFQFSLRLTQAGFATVSGRWSRLEPGATKDVGDVLMRRSTRLRGRIVDTKSAPVAGAEVHFSAAEPRSGDFAPDSNDVGKSQADGTFTGYGSLIGGQYSVRVPGRTIVSPKSVTIAGYEAEQVVEVVVEAIGDADIVAGIVVDELGKPLRGVSVWTVPLSNSDSSRGTDTEGRFRIVRWRTAPEEVALAFDRQGYEPQTTTETFRWGRTDVRVVLRSAIDVEISVVDSEGAPVEDYQVRIFPQPGTTRSWNSGDYDVRRRGRHEGGRTTIRGIRRGRQVVVVEPKCDALATSPLVPIEVADPGPTKVTVVLARSANRELRVHRVDGTPVAGTRVQLADAFGKALTLEARVAPLSQWGLSSHLDAVELQAATTDARGSVPLRGPGDRPLTVLLPGPANVPTVVTDVRLSEAEPLVVTVASGASLTGTLRPSSVVGELRLLARLPREGAVEPFDRSYLPRIELSRAEGPPHRHPDERRPVIVADDGTFATTGIPPGTWQVRLHWYFMSGNSGALETEDVAVVTLGDGESRTLEVDVTNLSPGVLDGIALHNGAPLANVKLDAICSLGMSPHGHERWHGQSARTDAAGRFQVRARPGEYRVSWQHANGSTLRAPETIHIVTGQTVAQTFHVRSGTVRARLLDKQERPVAGVRIELQDGAGTWRLLPPTDTDGRSSGEVEADSFAASVQHTPKAAQGPGTPMRLRCGTVRVQMGTTTDVELRLDVDWPP